MSRYRVVTCKKKKKYSRQFGNSQFVQFVYQKALERSTNWRENIVTDPSVLTGKPIIKSALHAV
ncbi:hypothetical protein [Methanosarcina spelaei]|uniref:hypothetical protein n=1 Tax=Methanosarcina spelaei TaxID=1036679 RepID=UPI001BAF11D6|nr:hypothetical protein [Methanosarcina spelaei]